MRGELLATVCGKDEHRQSMCPRWCDAGAISTDPLCEGSAWRPPTDTTKHGGATVKWEQIRRTGPTTAVVVHVSQMNVSGQMAEELPVRGLDYVPPSLPVDQVLEHQRAEDGIRALLTLMGEDPEREGIRDTPKRVVKAYLEMAARPGDPAELLSRVFGDVGQSSEMICVPGIQFVSLCEHHLLPFTGTATVAYIPQPEGAVVGLSKIPRLVHHWAMRPQVQERLTRQIADSLEDGLSTPGQGDYKHPPLGVAVRIDSVHSCMSLRGVKAHGASMVTTDLRGRFLEGAPRAEFLGEAMR